MKTVGLGKIRSKDYDKWEHKNCNYSKGDLPCVICGRTIRGEQAKTGHWLRMYEDGDFLTDDMETPDGELPGDMGCFPVGKNCWSKFQRLAEEASRNSAANLQ